jgi:ubiquinone/menaquinone biosynthesis C-methylase UbiE
MSYTEIDKRYSILATDACCLSCGEAINYSKALAGEICVDLGSGRGTDALRLAEEVGEEGFVYGIDISDGMIRKARSAAKKTGIKNVRFMKEKLENISLEENSINLVISNCTINHAANKQKVWLEIARILKTGGRFIVSDIYSLEPVPDKYKNDPIAIAECWAGAVTRVEYMSHLHNAGFSGIEILEESSPYDKGEIKVASFTIKGKISNCCCSNQ